MMRTLYMIIIIIQFSNCRHPDELKRPSFLNIVVALQQPDFKILSDWTSPTFDTLSGILGVGLDKSKDLYLDLQKTYIHVKSRESESRKAIASSDVQQTQNDQDILVTNANSEQCSDERKTSESSC